MHQHSQPSPGQSATSLVSPSPHGDTAEALQNVIQESIAHSDDADASVGQDAQREADIRSLGQAMQRAYSVYALAGDFAALGDAHRLRMEMEALIKGRSAAQVAGMERDRGLA